MPIAGYTNFEDCVSKNGDKDDPESYCGSIKAEVEKSMNGRSVLRALNRLSKQGSESMPVTDDPMLGEGWSKLQKKMRGRSVFKKLDAVMCK